MLLDGVQIHCLICCKYIVQSVSNTLFNLLQIHCPICRKYIVQSVTNISSNLLTVRVFTQLHNQCQQAKYRIRTKATKTAHIFSTCPGVEQILAFWQNLPEFPFSTGHFQCSCHKISQAGDMPVAFCDR